MNYDHHRGTKSGLLRLDLLPAINTRGQMGNWKEMRGTVNGWGLRHCISIVYSSILYPIAEHDVTDVAAPLPVL